MAQAAHKTCDICMRASALHFCTQCKQVFCDDCKVSHLRSSISRNHTFMVGGCKDHNEDFIYLCEDCDQLICRVCVTKAHQKHYLVDIRDSNNKVKTEISKCLDSKVDNIRLSANIIEEKAKTYTTEVEATVKGIIEQGNLIKAMVDEKVNALIKVLRERERIELQSLSKANKDCPDLLEEASKHQHIYQDMIKQCDEVASFHKMKKIKSDVDNLKTVDITSLPSATYNRKNVNFSDVDQLFGNVTFQETEVTVKKTKLSAELHNQDKQPKQEMTKDQPPTTKQLQIRTEENAGLRGTIERYKEQIADMSKQLELHQQEKDHILLMATSMIPWIADINERKNISNSCKLNRPEHMSVDSFVDNMELILNRVIDMKNEILTTEGNLAAKLANFANWMDEQRQIEEDLHQEIQERAKTIQAQDQELIIILSRIKEINSVSDDLKNENNKLRQQIFDNQKKATQQQIDQSHKLEVENDGLRRRLDRLAGDELTKDTPANTALRDPNRPMKIAEKYGALYDNEWTDAIDCMVEVKALYPDMKTAGIEEVIIRHIYQLVMCCYRECLALSKEQLKDVGNMIVNALKLNTKRHGPNIPCCKEVSNIRRQGATEYADYLFQHKVIVDKIVLSDWEYVHKSKELFGLLTQTPFFEKCIHLCWHMAIKDPVMHLDEELTPDTAYDKSVYREFAKSGDKVTFVVWPALFLHEGGPLLNKGVVQAYC